MENKMENIYKEFTNYINSNVKENLLKEEKYMEIMASRNDATFEKTLIDLPKELKNIEFSTIEEILEKLTEKELMLRRQSIEEYIMCFKSKNLIIDILNSQNYFINLKSIIDFETLSKKNNFIKLIHDFGYKKDLNLWFDIFEEIGEKLQKNDYTIENINYNRIDIYRHLKRDYLSTLKGKSMIQELIPEYEFIEYHITDKKIYIEKIFEYMLDDINDEDYDYLPRNYFIWKKNTDLKEIKKWLKDQIKNIKKLNN